MNVKLCHGNNSNGGHGGWFWIMSDVDCTSLTMNGRMVVTQPDELLLLASNDIYCLYNYAVNVYRNVDWSFV